MKNEMQAGIYDQYFSITKDTLLNDEERVSVLHLLLRCSDMTAKECDEVTDAIQFAENPDFNSVTVCQNYLIIHYGENNRKLDAVRAKRRCISSISEYERQRTVIERHCNLFETTDPTERWRIAFLQYAKDDITGALRNFLELAKKQFLPAIPFVIVTAYESKDFELSLKYAFTYQKKLEGYYLSCPRWVKVIALDVEKRLTPEVCARAERCSLSNDAEMRIGFL